MYKIFIIFICLCPTFQNVSFAYAETSNQINGSFERKKLSSELVEKNKINDRSMIDRSNPLNSIKKEEISKDASLKGSEPKAAVGPRFVEPNNSFICFFSVIKYKWLYVERITYTTMGISDCDKDKYYSISNEGIADSLKATLKPDNVNKEGIHLATGEFRAGVNSRFIYIGSMAIYPLEVTKISWPTYMMTKMNRAYQGTPPYTPRIMAGIKHFYFEKGINLIILKSPKKDLYILTSYNEELKNLQKTDEDFFETISESIYLDDGWSLHKVKLKKSTSMLTSAPPHYKELVVDPLGNRFERVTLPYDLKILNEEINN